MQYTQLCYNTQEWLMTSVKQISMLNNCLDLVVSTETHTLKYGLATSLEMQAVVVAKVISGIQSLQDSMFCPKVLRCETTWLVWITRATYQEIMTKMWAQILMALPSLAIKCKLHHKLAVLMKRHGANHFSHICTVQTHFLNLLGHMENIRILRTNLWTTWQNRSYKHVAVITSNPSHAWPFQKLRVSCTNLWQSIVYTCVFLSVGPSWTCTCFFGKPTIQANRKLCR